MPCAAGTGALADTCSAGAGPCCRLAVALAGGRLGADARPRQRVPPPGRRRQRRRVACVCRPARPRPRRTASPTRSRRSSPRCPTSGTSSPMPAASASAVRPQSVRAAAAWTSTCRPSERDMTRRRMGAARSRRKIDERGFPGARIFVRPPRHARAAHVRLGLRTSRSRSRATTWHELQRIGRRIWPASRACRGSRTCSRPTEEASPELAIELERERAAYLGLNVATVGQTRAHRAGRHGRDALHRGEQGVRRPRDVPRASGSTSPEDLGGDRAVPRRGRAGRRSTCATSPTSTRRSGRRRSTARTRTASSA